MERQANPDVKPFTVSTDGWVPAVPTLSLAALGLAEYRWLQRDVRQVQEDREQFALEL